MNGLEIAGLCALIVAGPLAGRWALAWRKQWVHAKHAAHGAPDPEPGELERDWYGSMNLDDEREWRTVTGWTCAGCGGGPIYGGTPPWCYGCGPNAATHGLDTLAASTTFLPAPTPLDWRDQTMAELAPEALDPGPGVVVPETPPPGPDPLTIREDWTAPPAAEIACRFCAETDAGWTCQADLGGRCPSNPDNYVPEEERLADTGDIRDAALLADTTAYMRDQDADVADWMARRAAEWARLEIGVLA